MAVNLYLNNSAILPNILGYLQPSSTKLVVNKKRKASPIGLKGPALEYPDGTIISGLLTVAKQIVKYSSTPDAQKLLGLSPEERADVNQWLDYSVTHVKPVLKDHAALQNVAKTLDTALEDNVYLVKHTFSLADIMMFQMMAQFMGTLTFAEKEKYLHLSRWYDQVQHIPRVRRKTPIVFFHRELLFYC